MTERLAYCTFWLDGMFFGVDVRRVQEVIRYQPTTHVPLAPAVVEGLINLRGQVVTAVDLRRLLELPERRQAQRPMNVVVRTDDGPVSLLVDEIGDVLEVDDASFEMPPTTFVGATRDLVVGVYKLERKLLLVLDLNRVLHAVAGAL